MQGKVIRIDKGSADIDGPGGVVKCAVRGRMKKGSREQRNVLAVGDDVRFNMTSEGEGVVEEVLERRTRLSRPDILNPKVEHVLIANLDLVVVLMTAYDPPFNAGLADRYTAAVLAHELDLLLVLNKTDLGISDEVRGDIDEFRSIGFRVIETSGTTGEGVGELESAITGCTSVFAGMSGSGKSTLLSRIIPDFNPSVAVVSDKTGKGRHTTTFVSLIPLPGGGYVADTPGVKLFGIWGVPRDELAFFFPDLARFKPDCRFNNCLHRSEPGCAVLAAVKSGNISRRRYDSYIQILKDLIEMEEVMDPNMRRDKYFAGEF
jgi:ribosome biogenesis GTPase